MKHRSRPTEHKASIAVLRPGRLGDVLLAIPGMRALRAAHPRTRITLIGRSWARYLHRRLPYWDDFLEFPGFPGMPDVPFHPDRTASFLRKVASRPYDVVLQLHGGEAPAGVFAALLGTEVIGYSWHEEVARHFTMCLPWDYEEHEIRRVIRVVTASGGQPLGVNTEFPILEADRAELDLLHPFQEALASGRPLVGIHAAAGSRERHWPTQRFAHLADRLSDEGYSVLLLGGVTDLPLVEKVRGASSSQPVSLAGQLSIGGLAALISELKLFVGNDSGPSHLAVAVGTPSVTIFCPRNIVRWAPLERRLHRVVSYPPPDGHRRQTGRCRLDLVTVEQVLAEAQDLLAGGIETGKTGDRCARSIPEGSVRETVA